MTPSGWIVMILSVGAVCCLFAWCMWKVMSTPNETEHMKGIQDHTPDEQEHETHTKEIGA
ncbi:hypothetical protein [Ruficoccus sp. ZRK36]|uniref:hypothetical protein n=1 Tax=Ruficoccus sp. ZRK36 TaxID=2866311 RepID=UPI001C736EC3|nr:hypothetical protein [Ruficoccus sp. ZRK36]QYY37529.1 hypothetical protein K0V07_02450 [Ruficoccus sp. ZRK36]